MEILIYIFESFSELTDSYMEGLAEERSANLR